jgi:hypothetical protein
MTLLPPKHWPINLWLGVGAAVLLLAHAIGLAVQLVLVLFAGGVPANIDATRVPIPAIVDSYAAQIAAGFIPGLAVLGLGVVASISAARHADERVARWGRILLSTLGILAAALIGLALPLLLGGA